MLNIIALIYILSILVSVLSLRVVSQKFRKRMNKRENPWMGSTPLPSKHIAPNQRMGQPSVLPPPQMFRQQ